MQAGVVEGVDVARIRAEGGIFKVERLLIVTEELDSELGVVPGVPSSVDVGKDFPARRDLGYQDSSEFPAPDEVEDFLNYPLYRGDLLYRGVPNRFVLLVEGPQALLRIVVLPGVIPNPDIGYGSVGGAVLGGAELVLVPEFRVVVYLEEKLCHRGAVIKGPYSLHVGLCQGVAQF